MLRGIYRTAAVAAAAAAAAGRQAGRGVGSDPIPGDDLGMICKALNYLHVFLGDISFYLVSEFVSSFSSRSYPSVRKCTVCI